MKKYNKGIKYSFYLLRNIKTGKLIVSSFHNINGECSPSSKNWIKASEKLATITVSNRKDYIGFKKQLEEIYLHR